MKINFSKSFIKKSSKLIQKNPQLEKSLVKQISLFKKNSKYPSLRLHKLKGQRSDQLTIWIEDDLRALCIQSHDEYVFFDLVKHDQY
ncbi:MAG: hypothetical protein GW942_02330 [Candidatus Pacebacteria bacterium]|nr:hypothetical protein [Candidatus Paceibacterota bacterium]